MANSDASTQAAELITPPESLLSKNPLRWLKFFGPGAIIASCTIGSGEVLFSARGGAVFGYNILWVFILASFLKWVLCYCSMRHMILSGAHPFERWSHIPGPRGWFPLFMFVIALISFPVWYSFLSGVLGTACKWIFGEGLIPGDHDTHVWASIALVLAMIIMMSGNYEKLEFVQIGLVLIMVVCMVLAVIVLQPDIVAALKGTFIPSVPKYPNWVKELDEFKARTPPLEIMVYVSAIGGASFDYLSYLSFLRDKKWGMAHMGVASNEVLDQIAKDKDHHARIWVRAAAIDSVASFAMIAFLSVCFSILGTVVLHPEQLVPKDENLLNYQARFMRELAPWLEPLYKVTIFAAFLPILYGGPEMNFRVIKELMNSMPRFRGNYPEKGLRIVFIFWVLGLGLVLLWVNWFVQQTVDPDFSLVRLISPAAIYTGVLTCGFFCLANPWADWKFLPPALRMNKLLVFLNILAGLIFVGMGIKALWDDWWWTDQKWMAYVLLASMAGVGILLAVILRKYLYQAPASSSAVGRD